MSIGTYGEPDAVSIAIDYAEKRFPSYNSFIVTALPIARIVRLKSPRPASQDLARIVFDCRMTDDPAMIN